MAAIPTETPPDQKHQDKAHSVEHGASDASGAKPTHSPPVKPPVQDESIFAELWDFMRVRKKFWLAPILIALVLLGMLFFFAQTAGVVSPFIYAL